MSLYEGVDMARVLYGEHARHVPAWLYVQDAGNGVVTFVGSSKVGEPHHPLRYDSDRTHQFIVGEIIVRPHLVIATDAFRGHGLSALAQLNDHNFERMLRKGEELIGRT